MTTRVTDIDIDLENQGVKATGRSYAKAPNKIGDRNDDHRTRQNDRDRLGIFRRDRRRGSVFSFAPADKYYRQAARRRAARLRLLRPAQLEDEIQKDRDHRHRQRSATKRHTSSSSSRKGHQIHGILLDEDLSAAKTRRRRPVKHQRRSSCRTRSHTPTTATSTA